MISYFTKTKCFLFLGLSVVLAACSTISKFDQYAYTQTTSIKVDALNVMNLATDKYSVHAATVTQVQTSIDKMYEYEKNRSKDQLTEKMWLVLRDSSQNLFGGFINRWKKEGTLDPVFIKEASGLVGQSFDQISQLESGKIKPSQVNN